MLKTMLLLSLNSIAHIRGLFPESQFTELDVKTSAFRNQCVLACGIQFFRDQASSVSDERFHRSRRQVQEAEANLSGFEAVPDVD